MRVTLVSRLSKDPPLGPDVGLVHHIFIHIVVGAAFCLDGEQSAAALLVQTTCHLPTRHLLGARSLELALRGWALPDFTCSTIAASIVNHPTTKK